MVRAGLGVQRRFEYVSVLREAAFKRFTDWGNPSTFPDWKLDSTVKSFPDAI